MLASTIFFAFKYYTKNATPVAYASSDQTLSNSVVLDGSKSTDTDGTITNYAWSIVSGSGNITSPNLATTTVTGLAFGTSTFQLLVTDNDGATSSDEISITINLVPRIAYWYGKVNQHMGLDGNWQTDPDGFSGADLDKLTYCQKWYPNTLSVKDYKVENINSWKAAGNTGNYSQTVMTTECVTGK